MQTSYPGKHEFLKGTYYALVFFLASGFSYIAFAIPPGSAYAPGATLNPTCLPGSANCTVSVSSAGLDGYIQFNTSGALASDAGLFWDNASKRLGIGTTTPLYTLDAVGFLNTDSGYKQKGDTILYASSTNQSSSVGIGAGTALLSDGLYNTALGYQALYTATSSDSNTAVGYRSLYSNTAGYDNTANGSLSLFSNTTGYSNTANGVQALYSNTTGYSNIANGVAALRSNTTGSNNTALGYQSLYTATSTSNNTAVGYQSLYSNTAGTFNTANGTQALRTNTTGSSNTANGFDALYSNTTGSWNTANGTQALRANTTGTSSVAFGYQSGYSNTTGSQNTFLGVNAGYGDGTSTTTADLVNATAIGYNAQVTASSSLVLGGTGAYAVKVGIGTTNPGEKLEVVGNIISKGTSWTSRASAADNSWTSITYGNGLFVAVAWTGTGNRVMTSPDGINWTSRTSAADNNWQSVTYGNGLFVAVADSGTGNRVMTSPDGINWTSRTSAADNQWYSVTYGNGLFVAVSYNGTGNKVMTSPDGITWTSRTNATDNIWNSVTYGNGLFVAVASTGTGNRVMTSPDGIIWTSRTSAADNTWYSVTYGNGLFVAVALNGTGNRVMTSPDGITWTSRTSAMAIGWISVTYGNGLFVAVSYSGGIGDNRVMTSPDGITWTSRTAAPNSYTWYSVTYGNGLFVAVASSGTGDRVMTSGKSESNILSHNNLYQGGMSIFGNVGIGTTTPLTKLSIQGTAGAYDVFSVASSTGASMLYINSSGSVGIGTASPSAPLEVKGTGTGATIAKFTDVNTTGCTIADGGTIACSSDVNLKKNIEGISYGLDMVMSLRPVFYNWNYENDGAVKSLGFIAQEVEALVSKLVSTDAGGMKSLNTTGIIPILTKALQELASEVRVVIAKVAGFAEVFMTRKVVTDTLEMKDSVTNDIYCVKIANGEWDKSKGSCEQVLPSTQMAVVTTEDTPAPDLATTTPSVEETASSTVDIVVEDPVVTETVTTDLPAVEIVADSTADITSEILP